MPNDHPPQSRQQLSQPREMNLDFSPLPKFSAELERSLADVFPSDDPLDSDEFDPIAYINMQFPDEASLMQREGEEKSQETTRLNSVLTQLKRRVIVLQEDITQNIKTNSCQRGKTKQAIADAKQSIQDLFHKIKSIKEKADKSEMMVQEICRDIKSLDYAKQHLTSTINSLQNLRILVSAVEQLAANADNRQYKDAAHLFKAVEDLLDSFKQYDDIPQLIDLKERVQLTKEELRGHIMQDFKDYSPSAGVAGKEDSIQRLHNACLVVDVLEPDVRQRLIDWVVSVQLDGYHAVFSPGKEGGTLDQTERRFAWLKRQLRSYEESYEPIFPHAWDVPFYITRKFCQQTKRHLKTILTSGTGAHDVSTLIRVLTRTKDFEREQQIKFRASIIGHEDELMGLTYHDRNKLIKAEKLANEQGDKPDMEVRSKMEWDGFISEVFMGHLTGYVELERSNISDLVDRVIQEEQWIPSESQAKARLQGSDELFVYIKRSINRCTRLTNGEIFYNIIKEYQAGLQQYADRIEARLATTYSKEYDITPGHLRSLCLIVNTAEYCNETLTPLEETLQGAVHEQYKQSIDLSAEQEVFQVLITRVVQLAVSGFMSRINRIFQAMVKMPWATWEAVGDQSPYVNEIYSIFTDLMPIVSDMLSSAYHNFFCLQIANAFVPKFEESIFKIKKIGDMGAPQLALDTHSLKGILLQIPALQSEEKETKGRGASRAYTRMVNREMGRIEAVLKIMQSDDRKLIQTFKTLLPKESKAKNAAEVLAKVMGLKGLRSSEQQALVDDYNNSVPQSEWITAPPDSSISLRSIFKFSK